MADTDNPAGRLHVVFSKLRAGQGDQPFGLAMGKVLGADYKSDLAGYLDGFAAVARLPAAIRAEFDWLAPRVPSIETRLPAFEQVLAKANAHSALKGHITGIGDAEMDALVNASAQWHLHTPGVVVPADRLDSLRAEIDALRSEVIDTADVEDALRAFLVDRLHDMLRAIDLYPVTGADGLRTAMERALGGVVLHVVNQPKARKTTAVTKFLQVLGAIGTAVAVNLATPAISQHLPNALNAGTEAQPGAVVVNVSLHDACVIDVKTIEVSTADMAALSSVPAEPAP